MGVKHGDGGGDGVVQVLLVVTHAPAVPTAEPCGEGQLYVVVWLCVMLPVCGAGHPSICVFVDGPGATHFGAHTLATVGDHGDQVPGVVV